MTRSMPKAPITLVFGMLSFACVLSSPSLLPQAFAQATLRGYVRDDSTGAPLPLANVFVANSSIGASADSAGWFSFRGVPLGTHEIFASILGYEPKSVRVRVTEERVYTVEFRLKPRAIPLPPFEVLEDAPTEWRANLERFVNSFLGATRNAAQCKLLNPHVLEFVVDKESGQFTASASVPLEIENRALGYHVQYFLREFMESSVVMRYLGVSKFQDLKPKDADEAERWRNNRLRAYHGSAQHFYASLVKGGVKEEGFEVYRIAESWHPRALARPVGDDVTYESLTVPAGLSFERRLSFRGWLQVIYTREEPEPAYCDSLGRLLRRWLGPLSNCRQISLIQMNGPIVVIQSNGLLTDPLSISNHGYWAYERTAETLPVDYDPNADRAKGMK